MPNISNPMGIHCIDNVDSYEMYKLRIYISWMSKNVILLPTYIYVDTSIIGECKRPCRLKKFCVIKRSFIWQLVLFCFYCISNILNRSRIYCIDNVDLYEMYKLRIYISWMSKNVILLPTYIYVDTSIIRECKRPCRLKKFCVIKRSFIWQLVLFCFYCISNILNRSRIYCIDNVDSYEMYKLRIYISWMSKNVILLPTYIYVDTSIIPECKRPCRLKNFCVIKRSFIWQLVLFCFYCISNILNRSRIYCIDNVDLYEMYKLRIYISWMSKSVVLLPTYIYVDTSIIGESKRPRRLQNFCVIKRSFISQLVPFCF